jgi:serine phosphatase RsbU (regulator of sigma subunit)
LTSDASGQLASLAAVYPGTPVILLVEPVTGGNGSGEWLLLQALSAGATDYVTLSSAGLLTLGRRLAGLQHQTEQSRGENLALYQIASILTTTQDAQTIISTVLEGYLRALDLRQGSAVMFDFEAKCGIVKVSFRDNQPALKPIEADAGNPGVLEGQRIPLANDPIYKRLMRTYQPVMIEDVRAAGAAMFHQENPGWIGPGALSLLIIPIQIRGDIVGALVVEVTRSRPAFEPWEISLGQVMADQLGIALQNVQLYEAEYQRRRQAETLREVSFVVGSSLNLSDVLERILDQLGRVVKYDSAAIHLIQGKYRRIIAGRGFPHPEKVVGLTFPVQLDECEPGSIAIHTRQPVVIGDIQGQYELFRDLPHHHINSWMGIPLIARDKVIGLITIDQVELNAFQQEDVALALAFASQAAVALENARLHELEVKELERELEIAQEIQETLLPQFVPQIPGLQISGRLLPAQHIGGDFFHFFSLGNNRLGVTIGDVSGKGIPAALYMAVAITAIDINTRNPLTPAELLNQLNDNLYVRLKENKMNVGLQVATFAPLPENSAKLSPHQPAVQGAIVSVASAGMIAPIGATVHGCRFLPVSGLPLGVLPYPEQIYSDEEFLLDPFTTVIFTSDGIVEARNEAGELFGFERLEATVNEIIETRDAEIIAEHIIHTAQAFIGQAEQNDDMAVVVVVKT